MGTLCHNKPISCFGLSRRSVESIRIWLWLRALLWALTRTEGHRERDKRALPMRYAQTTLSRLQLFSGQLGSAGLLSLLALLLLSQPSFAQSTQSKPVARLILGPAKITSFSRPRRASDTRSSDTRTSSERFKSPALDDATPIERRAFQMTNFVRLQNGLPPLLWDSVLCRMARLHSEDMARRNFFSHQTPEGLRLRHRAYSNGIVHWRVLAENIAYNQGYDDPGAFAVEKWMLSAGHRSNILSVEYQQSGIGSFVTAEGRVFITQVFITR
jgi:uncharacterized protein YkwD